ncbi:MAG: family 16 glycosylhydrolase [Oscillospiraceae bacterium]|nr:family 16 glycosylhydrolase [Oscillospiraceae bacterium]
MKQKKLLSIFMAFVMVISLMPLYVSAVKKGISLNKSVMTMMEGSTFLLEAAVKGIDDYDISWSSSNKNVAAVSKSGNVTAKSTGTAIITAKVKGTSYKARCTVTVRTVTSADFEDYSSITIDENSYSLTFEDDFDGTELDSTKWKRCNQEKRQNLNGWWDDSMSYLDGNGNLIIEMSYDGESDRFLSGGVESKGLFEQAYGYFEIRCAVNNVPGYWTAFWLMGDSVLDETEGGKNGTEIDIMETPYYSTGEVQNTLNWDGYGDAHKSEGEVSKLDIYDGEYHTFSLLWKEDEYVFYTDGIETWRTDAQKALGVCEVPLYMIISSEMGTWAKGLDSKNLPDYMKVDYVRVYA